MYKTLIKRDVLHDPARENRQVPIKFYYPDLPDNPSDHKWPLIIWSHGLGGGVEGAGFLARFLAENGYLVCHVQHEGTDTSLWEGKPGHPWDVIRATKITRETTLNRFRDVPFVLDRLPDWLAQHKEIKAAIDFNRLGMSGHSFGALTTQVIAGMKFPDAHGELHDMSDGRFKAAIAYSPNPIAHLGDFPVAETYGSINRPILFMTGTKDDSPIEGWDYRARLPVYTEIPDNIDKYLLVLEDGDHMVFNGTRGKLGQSKLKEQHEAQICKGSLLFWDTYLKEESGNRQKLDAFIQNSSVSHQA